MAYVEGKIDLRSKIVKFPGSFHLLLHAKAYLIFESCLIIQNLPNLHLMMLFLHVVHTQ